jgi:GntR family transcriptional regulator
VPAYRQLADILQRQIDAGDLQQPDSELPSETTLIHAYGVARGTVRHAIAVLRDRDLVVTVQGRGTCVRGATRQRSTPMPCSRLTSASRACAEHGREAARLLSK